MLEPAAFFLVLLSAAMHAGWNLIAKLGNDRLLAMAVIKAPNIVLSVALVAWAGWPARESWPFLAASAAINAFYFHFLIRAYQSGDLGVAYPVARGVAPLLVMVLSGVVMAEIPSAAGVVGVLLISGALFALAARGGADPTGKHRTTILWAIAVGLTIAAYTMVDGLGGRASGNVIGYVAALNIFTGLWVCGAALAQRPTAFAHALRARWRKGVVGGAMMLLSYLIVVYAMTLAPMAQVAALRETSVIFAALLGTMFLHEPLGRLRITIAAVVAAGIALIAISR